MSGFGRISDDDYRSFWDDGYLFKRGYLSPEEVALAHETIRTDPSGSYAACLAFRFESRQR